MITQTTGIHHITAIAADAQKTYYFYTTILGLRLVKKTVNQDDVKTYHLFFGDRLGHPGMDLTFFIFLPPTQGIRGNGLVTMISFAVSEASLTFWIDRFKKNNVKHEEISERFGKKRIVFFDEDNQQLELVGLTNDELDKNADRWETKEIKKEHAILNFYSATLSTSHKELIDPILTQLFSYTYQSTEGNNHLYRVGNSHRAYYLEIDAHPSREYGEYGAGTVHHIAFRAKNDGELNDFKKKLDSLGLHHTSTIDRFYFHSVYFRIPAGILFEIATDTPGFTADEKEEMLGKELALPPFLEKDRAEIEKNLMPLPTT